MTSCDTRHGIIYLKLETDIFGVPTNLKLKSKLNTDWTEVEVIELIVDSATHLGFGMCGSKSTGVIVRCITPGGAAELDGRLRLGDHIVSIRDHNVRSYGPDQVATVLRQTISSCLSEGILTQDTSHISEISTSRMINTTLTTKTPASTNTVSPTFTNNTNMLSDKYNLSPNHATSSHMESDKTEPTNQQSVTNPSVLLRLIVARPAIGTPTDLSEISLKQKVICRQHHVLGMVTIIPTHQLDQYIDLLLHKNLPFVDLCNYCKTNSLDIENNCDTIEIKSNHEDHFELRKSVNCIESEFLKMNDINESFLMSSNQLEQSDVDDIREIEPCSTLEVSISSQNSSESDVEKTDTNLPSRIITDDFIDNTFKCNRMLNSQQHTSSCSIPSPFNEYVTGNISQKDSPIRVKNDNNEDDDETEIHIVHLTKPKDQGLGLCIVGYIYKNPYDDNVQAVSILKKSDTNITLKLKRYLHGFLYEELQKSGHLTINNNPIQNHLTKASNTSLLDQTSDQAYPINNSAFINSETSESSEPTTMGKLHQHEYYLLDDNNFNQSDILYVELTEDFIDPSCSSLSDHEGILKSLVLGNEESTEMSQMSNNNNIHQLSPEFLSERFVIDTNSRTLKHSDANLGDNTESFNQEVTASIIMPTMTTIAANKHDFLNVTMDVEDDGYIEIINDTGDNSDSQINSCKPAVLSSEATTKLEASPSTCKKVFNTLDPITFDNDTVASRRINDSDTLFDKKFEIANEVTEELVDLMRRVWLPIVGPGYDIIVLRFHKPRGISNLGISVQGVTYVAEPDFCYRNQSSISDSAIGDKFVVNNQLAANGLGKSIDSYDNGYNDKPSRHFIQYIVPDGLIGSLGVVQKGDELLQANGHRIRGTSHTSTLRYLRNLPSRIELVFARRKSTHENKNNKMLNITSENDQTIDSGTGEPPLEVVSSDVGSVDTTPSTRIVNTYGDVDQSVYSSPVSPATAHKRVTEWIRKSQGDLSAASPESSIIEQTHTKSKTVNSYSFEHSDSYTFGPRHDCMNSDYTINSKQYLVNTIEDKRKLLPNTQIEMDSNTLGRTSASRSSREFAGQQSPVEHYDLRRYQTLPHYLHNNRPNRIDPRYGFKRPRWSSVPLIIHLNKTSHGFGFSIAEYEELPVTDLESKSYRKALTFDRKTSTLTESDRLSFRSYYSTASTTTSLNNNPKTSNSLKRRSTWSSRSKTRGILLIDSLTPGGVAQLDGRISIGDRLLFVNDKNLIKASIRKAANTLKSLPNGPCLIGIAKMQLESNETYRTQEQQQRLLSYPLVPTRPSAIGMFPDPDEMKKISDHYNLAHPLHVNTCGSITNNDDNNTIVNDLCATACEDLALDFYTLPLLCPNPQLHSPELQYATPVDPKLEITRRLERGSLPIGLKLDALACHGQDGCRVLQVLGGGAIARDQFLVTNDYVTSLNGISMRYLDNLKAFEILHSLSQNSAIIDITFFPASIIESHRIKCLSKAMNQPSEDHFQKNSIPFLSIVHPLNWSPAIEIVLYRVDASQQWGLVVSGPDICSTFNCSAPLGLENPSILSEILPNSVGRNCKLLSCGLLILKIQGNDVSTKGANYVNAYLQHLSNQSDLCELHLVVCHFDDSNDDDFANNTTMCGIGQSIFPINKHPLDSQDINNNNNNSWTNGFDCTGKIELSNDSNIPTSINAQLECDYFIPRRTSPSSSDMENPEPLTDMESHDIVDILCRSDPPSDPNNFGSQPNPYRRNSQCLLSQLSSPVLEDEDNITVGADVTFPGVRSDMKMKLQNGWLRDGDDCSFSSPPPPPLLPKRLSISSKHNDTEKLQPVLVGDLNTNQLNSSDLVKFYTRNSQDEIRVIRLPILHNSASNYNPNVNEVIRNFDLDLVSCCNPEMLATFVAKCQNNFNSRDSDDCLQSGDEIVQVEDISVCGLNHLSVQQIIHSKVVEILLNKVDNNDRTTYHHSVDSSDGGRIDGSSKSIVKPFISLIIRRNPINRSLISSSHFSDSSVNVVSKIPEVYSVLNENLTSKNSSDTFSSPSPNFLPTGSKPIPHSFLKQIMVELNEDFQKFQLFDIVLERGSDGFGIFIVNMGRNNEPGVFVTEIRENSPASLQAVLRPHDRILAIDGQLQCDYESTLELLQQSRKSVRLTIGRQISYLSDPPSSDQMITLGDNTVVDDKHHKLPIIPGIPSSVTLYKTDGGLGFSIVGGSDTVLGNILIHEVHSGGAAARDGRLQVGDRLLAVNGIDLREATQKDATKIIRTANDCIQLIVYRDPEPQYLNHDKFECHNVHLKRDMPGCGFGLSLIDRPHYSTGTAIGAITENSPAARSNLLEVGDVILEINGWDMRLAKSDEVITLLKNVHSDVKLLIGRYKTAPSSHAYPRNRLHVYVVVLERRQLVFSNDLSHVKKCYSTHLLPTLVHDDVNKHTQSEQEQHNANLLVNPVYQKTDKSDVHDLYSLSNHSSTVNVDHKSDVGNDDEIALAAFGLRIRQANSQELWDSHSRLIVDSVQNNSPADRSGMIMPGDRLLSVDREPVDWLNPNEVVQLLANLPYCTIELGRLPYFNTSLSTDNNPISDKCVRHHSPSAVSLSASHGIQQDEHDIFPPYPPPSQELPALLGGIMPYIEPPSFLRDMCTLPEQQNEYDESEIGLEHGENDDDDRHHCRLSEPSFHTIYPNNHHDQIESMSNMTPLKKEEIEKALELAGRSNGGFFVRQIYLPIAPINNSINNTVKSNPQSDIHLGLRLTNGPGVSGPVVVRIVPNSCASRTDIQIGDRILGLDDKLLLSLSQVNNSADDILCTIESVWITRSMNSQAIYEQNPCCLTIVSNHNLPLFTSISKRKDDLIMEKEENLIKCPENNTQLAVCLGDLHLTNDNHSNHNRIDNIEKENLENHLVPSTTIAPLSFESKPPEVTGKNDHSQYDGPKIDNPYLDDGSYQASMSLHNHHYEFPVHPNNDILRHLPDKNLFVDSVSKMKIDPKDATAVVFNTTSVRKHPNGNKRAYSSSFVESISSPFPLPPPNDDDVMHNYQLMNISCTLPPSRKLSLQNNVNHYSDNGIMVNKGISFNLFDSNG
ncbi:hypothetical protein MN116_008166 [Schistosoma mekongi]|uniref:PDZ domain-containing protein n=1 Tax=Schistosoma mekongi TaxID=38744 RepID=A0AAE1Z6W3_SCHME|nr:hypothetical protein MN116_008166 [Schistosoma mekongi]